MKSIFDTFDFLRYFYIESTKKNLECNAIHVCKFNHTERFTDLGKLNFPMVVRFKA